MLYRIAPGASTPDSSSPDKTKRATTTTAKPVTSTPDTSPTKAWNDPLAQAKANSPQQSATVKPDDSLWGIGTSHSDTLPSVEGVNHDLYGPGLGYNLIHPGQTVDLHKKTLLEVVTGVNNSQIKPVITAMVYANAADRDVEFGPPGDVKTLLSAARRKRFSYIPGSRCGL